ncbi:hypothetical protein [Tsuneonella suprasediminis]|uniref:hypothetical protein n=1 Tax=Tsuneonella suprasediminis TaxID=2306996 RepID=UPI0010585C27|nr:hypothetical protein [Tsuneonella suprasediminis]
MKSDNLRLKLKVNVHTWARLTRLDLQNLSVSLGNAALKFRKQWPQNGEGREIKATTEKITRTLDRTFDRRDLNFSFDVIEEVISYFNNLTKNSFFIDSISSEIYIDRKGNYSTYYEYISSVLTSYSSYISAHRPPRENKTKIINKSTNINKNTLNQTLGDIVPGQKLAPIQFSVSNGKLYIRRQNYKSKREDRHLLTYGKTALQTDASSIIESLGKTNVDPRLSVAIAEIRDVLGSDADVIRLGMLSTTCDVLVRRFNEQLPETISAKFEAFGTNLSMFVSQFPDWQKFVTNADLGKEIEYKDVSNIFSVGMNFVNLLKSNEDLIDPQVPKSIQLLLEAIRDPSTSSKRAIFGVVRTLENLIATIFTSFGNLFGAGFTGVSDGLKVSAKWATIMFLLTATANNATTLAPSISKITISDWMTQASEIIKKSIGSGS